MKIKYFLPVIAGLAMTACNSEEDLLNNSVNELKTSPITFTFEGEDPLSRAVVEDGAAVVKFEEGDLTSLFNGLSTWGTGDFKNNAVYEAKSSVTENGGAVLEFSTASMVYEGEAIMVYPADTTFAAISDDGIVLRVAMQQDAETKEKAPYITDVLNIDSYDADKSDKATAGYGRNYPIALKKVANTWRLDLVALNRDLIENVADEEYPLTFQKALVGNDQPIFNKSIKVNKGTTQSLLPTNKPNKGYDYVGKQTVYEEITGENVTEITSTDFEKWNDDQTESFTFTVLPNVANVTPANAYIEIQTNYGKVRVNTAATVDEDDATTYPLINATNKEEVPSTLNSYIQGLLNGYKTQISKAENGSFKGQVVGGRLPRQFTFDFENLDMNELDIVDSKHLISVLNVYKSLGLDTDIELNLKAPESANGVFLLTANALKKLAEVNAEGHITLDDDQHSNAVRLKNNDLTAFNSVGVKFKGNKANVYLNSTWTLAQNADLSKMTSLTTETGCTLTLTPAVGTGVIPETVPFANGVPFVNNGTLILNGKIYVKEMTSNGIVTIAKGNSLYTVGNTYLYGSVENKGDLTSYSESLCNFATIDNYGSIGTLKANGSKLVNGGTINIKDDNALTFITHNAYKGTKGTYYGTINLKNRNDEVKVEEANTLVSTGYQNGYIKYTITADEDIVFESATGDKFNYLIVNGGKDYVKVDLNKLDAAVTFMKVSGSEVNIIRTETDMTLRDLIIDSSMRWLTANKKLTVKGNIYVKGIFRHAGNVSGTKSTSYSSMTYGESVDNNYKGEIINTVG